MYTAEDGKGGYALYGVRTGDIEDKIKMASGIDTDSLYQYWSKGVDFDHIFYKKGNALYVAGFDRESEKLAKDATVYDCSEGIVYYSEESGTPLKLYDYVTDEKAEADAGISEPREEDFSVPDYEYEWIDLDRSGVADPPESFYPELYTSCTQGLYWYDTLDGSRDFLSMEEAVSGELSSATSNQAEIVSATRAFIDKFSSQADADGYILVTDEVKEYLKAISQYGVMRDGVKSYWSGTPYEESAAKEISWLWLCFTRQQSGTRLDYDAYYEAYNKYDEAKGRIYAREELKSPQNEYPVSTLYCYNKGTVTPVHENVLACRIFSGVLMYNTVDMTTDKVDLEENGGVSDVTDLFQLKLGAENYLVAADGSTSELRMSRKAAEAAEDDGGYGQLYYCGKTLYRLADEELSAAPVDAGVVGAFSLIDDEVNDVAVGYSGEFRDIPGGGTGDIYYLKGIRDIDDEYGDLYFCTGGKPDCLLQDVYRASEIRIYEDGTILAYTDYNCRGGELTMVDSGGKAIRITEDVTQYVKTGKASVLCISDEDLYYCSGSEKKRIASDVDRIYALNPVKISQILHGIQ